MDLIVVDGSVTVEPRAQEPDATGYLRATDLDELRPGSIKWGDSSAAFSSVTQ